MKRANLVALLLWVLMTYYVALLAVTKTAGFQWFVAQYRPTLP